MKTEFEKKRCPKELCIEQYFGVQFNENHNPNADFGTLADLLQSYEQHIQSNPSEFGLVKKEDYDRQVHLVNHYRKLVYKDSKLDISEQDEEAMKDMKIVQSGSNQHHADQLAEALRGLLSRDTGCPMCDNGKLRSPEKEHWDDCKWNNAQTTLTNYEQGKGNDGWISVEERLPTKDDAYPDYDEVLTIQHGRKRPTMMKYWEVKHCPFTYLWMKVPPAPQFNYEQNNKTDKS